MVFLKKINSWISSCTKFLTRNQRSIGLWLLSIGAGGIASEILIISQSSAFLSMREQATDALMSGRIPLDARTFSYLVVFLCSIAIIISPLVIFNIERRAKRISFLLALAFVDVIIFCAAIFVEDFFLVLEIAVWFSASYVLRQLIDVLGLLRQWVEIKDEKRYDVAKLTLIWTVLAFLIGKLI